MNRSIASAIPFSFSRPYRHASAVAAAFAFLVLFAGPLLTMTRDWWDNPDAGHGLLLAPLAVWLAWRQGIVAERRPQLAAGAVLLVAGVLFRFVGAMAAELFTMRLGLLTAGVGLVLWYAGWPQLRAWWLPTALIALSIPLPAVVLGTLALPLQLEASQLGAGMLEWRQVPVLLQGNVIHLPGHTLFVTEACSGLRSLSSLLALGVLIGGLWLKTIPGRALVLLLAIPVAILLNGVRVFLTGFLVFFVSPELGNGFMHLTEGWIIFVVAFAILGLLAWAIASSERLIGSFRPGRQG